MGKTKKSLKKEIEHVFETVLGDLTEKERQLTHEEKLELRAFLAGLEHGKIHDYCYVLIKKFIRKLVSKRAGKKS